MIETNSKNHNPHLNLITVFMLCSFSIYKAEAPEIISINSLVITAWRVLLNVRVNLSIISPAFLLALSMAVILEDCSLEGKSFIIKNLLESNVNHKVPNKKCRNAKVNSHTVKGFELNAGNSRFR